MHRFIVEDGQITGDDLTRDGLRAWIEGKDPETGQLRGRDISSPQADLLLDSTINAPKSFSVAALLDEDLAEAYEGLQDRLRDRIIVAWQSELNARRGAAGSVRENLLRIEVVELKHERSRSLDPHKHRHLWLNVKVLGEDGRWSNIDSRVAMRFQNVVNAEGDLAARTDPAWIAALAAKGYSIDEHGEIRELAHVVRPLSRRSNQIEANRAMKTAVWREEHPGQEPGKRALMTIDKWAWAHDRPNKPKGLDEGDWAAMVRGELEELDPTIGETNRAAVTVAATRLADVDRDLLAAKSVVDADRRSAGTGGRFSRFDVRAGVVRAVAASGVVAGRALLVELIEDVTERALENGVIDFLDSEAAVPAHLKNYMAVETATVKVDLGVGLDLLHNAGVTVPAETIVEVGAGLLGAGQELDGNQIAAAAATAGTDRLVTVTGPAGAGKTTMLRVARAALANQGRGCIIVAPTKKAASVAGRETGAAASSLHALLVDHGFRFGEDAAGRPQWSQLRPGEAIPGIGRVYEGPTRFAIRPGDRIVVDEAGMLDLYAAKALTDLAVQTGAGIAMIGDHLQVAPVGHGGAMAIARERATAATELSAVHRFRKPDGSLDVEYAELSLRLRDAGNAESAAAVAAQLFTTGHVSIAATDVEARSLMVDRYFETTTLGHTVALVTSTNAEAQMINEAIQAERVKRGQIDPTRTVVGQGDQLVCVGDVVQTRKNDAAADVENRALWKVQGIDRGEVLLESATQVGVVRRVNADYFAQYVHLAYASTVHGIQGETTDKSITGPGVDASGLYVGMTRGKTHNEAIVVAGDQVKAREELVAAMRRGIPEITLEDSRAAAAAELRRAARTPAETDTVPVAWTERQFGHLSSPQESLDSILAGQKPAHERLSALADRIATDRKLTLELGARVVGLAAHDHALTATTQRVDGGARVELLSVLERTRERIEANLAEQQTLSTAYRKSMNTADQLHGELRTRELLPEAVQEAEERARHARSQQRPAASTNATTGPVIGVDKSTSGPSL